LAFTGTYEHSIDAKNRLAIPADIRNLIAQQAACDKDGKEPICLYVTPGTGKTLYLYPEKVFNQRAEELINSDLDPDELLDFEQVFFGWANRVTLDKQGRVRLPEHLLAKAELGTEVALVGVHDHLEIHDRTTWQQRSEQIFERFRQAMNPRRMKRARPTTE
jgi:MraZ protein